MNYHEVKQACYRGIDPSVYFKDHKTNIDDIADEGNLNLLMRSCMDISANEFTLWLLKAGANPNKQNINGFTPLVFSIYQNNIAAVRHLLENHVDLNLKDGDGLSPLHFCSNFNRVAIAKLLIENGANIKTVSLKGLTPVEAARILQHSEMVKLYNSYNQE